jgi:hypothetical protein
VGIIKRLKRGEKSIVKRRREDVTPEYFDWMAAAKQSAAPAYLNFGAGLRPAEKVMLREHHLVNYRTLPSWPPIWLRRRQNNGTTRQAITPRARLRGEIGILKDACLSTVGQPPRIFLIVAHEGGEYLGSLFLSDRAFCRQIYELLKRHCGKTIAEIGALELPPGSDPRSSAEKIASSVNWEGA